ncbi:helix-turn-helix transcriptional regulator [Saccharopolyspora sp. WRP15-2]|uniref:Helix-turn-helix transcriptional regulator n=1 Tax=Saccharopolyspora oryzae TaxID=2997343 RepID=A0ABT4VBM8_9PSEU|nr:helix-turn-helix transcriptional regulator [Saccharopolyspora oryzae]MDA3630819.1 helix-turn-helix transcriptional regulator [Saccharopolyspora oryzae]
MTTARSRGLGAEVRKLRKDAGLKLEELADQCGWSRATFGRIEAGDKILTGTELAIILGTLGIKGNERKRLLELASDAHKTHWWEVGYTELPSQLVSLLEFERTATKITDVALGFVPGLLQTADYARAVISTGGVSEKALESRVSLRLGRQSVLTRKNPVKLHALIDEAVVQRPVGGEAVMAEQLRHLVRVSERPHVTIQVVPFSAGEHCGLNGSNMILEFHRQRPIVHLEHRRSAIFLDDPEDTFLFSKAATSVAEAALSPTASIELISSRAKTLEACDESAN